MRAIIETTVIAVLIVGVIPAALGICLSCLAASPPEALYAWLPDWFIAWLWYGTTKGRS